MVEDSAVHHAEEPRERDARPEREPRQLAPCDRTAARDRRRERDERGEAKVSRVRLAAERRELAVLVRCARDGERGETRHQHRPDCARGEERMGGAEQRDAEEEAVPRDALESARLPHRVPAHRHGRRRVVEQARDDEAHAGGDGRDRECAQRREAPDCDAERTLVAMAGVVGHERGERHGRHRGVEPLEAPASEATDERGPHGKRGQTDVCRGEEPEQEGDDDRGLQEPYLRARGAMLNV